MPHLKLLAKLGCFTFLLALPFALYFAWPRVSLVAFAILAFVPVKLALLSFVWPQVKLLSWVALASNVIFASISAYAFVRMSLNVRAPPDFVSTLPVLLAAYVLLLTPILNAIAIWRGARSAAPVGDPPSNYALERTNGTGFDVF